MVLPRAMPQFCQLPPHSDLQRQPGDLPGVGQRLRRLRDGGAEPGAARRPRGERHHAHLHRHASRSTASTATATATPNDSVVTLRDRATGVDEPARRDAGLRPRRRRRGPRRAARQSSRRSRFPAVAVENDVLAFLEIEAGRTRCDENGDGDVVRRHPAHLPARRSARPRRAAPRRRRGAADRRRAARGLERPRLRARVRGRAGGARRPQRASRDVTTTATPSAAQPFGISGDGRYVAFSTRAATICSARARDTNGHYDVFRYDRVDRHEPARERADRRRRRRTATSYQPPSSRGRPLRRLREPATNLSRPAATLTNRTSSSATS